MFSEQKWGGFMDWLFDNNQGFKMGIDDMGNAVFNIDPNIIPVEAPGFLIINSGFQLNGIPSLGVSIGEFNLGGEFTLQDQINDIYFHGDSLLKLQTPVSAKLKKYGTEFNIDLIPNNKNRAGKLRVSCSNTEWTFDEINKYIFEIGNEMLNNIAVTYCIPIGFVYFAVFHHDMRLYTLVEAKAKTIEFNSVMLEPKSDWGLWHLSAGNYRKAMLSLNPTERFLNLYLAIEGVLSSIKKELDIDHTRGGKIEHPKYVEPVLDRDFCINCPSEFPNIPGKTFFEILFTENGFRKLRNEAAHAILYSGDYMLNTDLESYIKYQAAIPYLNHFYLTYANILFELVYRA